MGGFQYVTMSGLVAQTGVTNPELTNRLIIAGGIGFGLIYFFQWLFPLIGIYASIRILSGANFRYLVLGKLATRWGKSEQGSVSAILASGEDEPGNHKVSRSILSAIANLLAVFGLAAVVNPMIWALRKGTSQRDRYALLQAAIFDLLVHGTLAFLFFGFIVLIVILALFGPSMGSFIDTLFSSPLSNDLPGYVFFGFLALIFIVGRGISLIGAIAEFRGGRFRYPLIGKRIEAYLTKSSG
jgi:hypothetical protein